MFGVGFRDLGLGVQGVLVRTVRDGACVCKSMG